MTKTSKKMTIVFDQKVDFLGHALEGMIASAGRVGKTIAKLPWLLALFILLVVGFLYTLLAYLPLLFSRIAIERLINSMIKDVALLEERDAMLMHADVEEARRRLDRNAREIKVFFVFKPLLNQITKTTIHYRRFEQALFRVAYPEYNSDLTKAQEKELLRAFADWKEPEDEHELSAKTL